MEKWRNGKEKKVLSIDPHSDTFPFYPFILFTRLSLFAVFSFTLFPLRLHPSRPVATAGTARGRA